MNKRDVYKQGYENGYEIAKGSADDVYREWVLEGVRGKEAGRDSLIDRLVADASADESENFRQFSPFEFFAKEINDSKDPEGLWAAYEDGVHKGASVAAIEYAKDLVKELGKSLGLENA